MLCSIVIPTKDRPAGLLRAVRSAMAALPEAGEVVVVDDQSTPPAAKTLAPLAAPALRVVRNPGPHGPAGARNYGVDQARGAVIFFLDDDDTLEPGYCREVLARLDDLPAETGFGFSALMIRQTDGTDRRAGAGRTGLRGVEAPIASRMAGLGCGFWIRRALFQSLGGLDPALWVNEDTDFCLRLAAAGVLAHYSAAAGVTIFQDAVRDACDRASLTRSARAFDRAQGWERILQRHDAFLADHRRFRRKLLLRVLKFRLRAGRRDGWTGFCRALRPDAGTRAIWLLGLVWLTLAAPFRTKRR
jgi:glycosyltransferase involved in cell wall biosynthesis